MYERFRRMAAAGGWLDILALVLAAAVIAALSLCTNLEDVAEAVSKPSPAVAGGVNYGGALVGILAVFVALSMLFLLGATGIFCAIGGIVTLIGCKKHTDELPFARIRFGIIADAVFLLLDGAALIGAVFLLFSKWQPAERAGMICLCAALLVCMGLALALKAATYIRCRGIGKIYSGA